MIINIYLEAGLKKHTYKKRKSKLELSGKSYICEICYKCYLRYAACYMHLMKKHNLTTSELKNKISIIKLIIAKKRRLSSNEILKSLSLKDKSKCLINYKEVFMKCYEDIYILNSASYSTFILNNNSSYELHPLYSKILEMKCKLDNEDKSPLKLIKNIDDSLAIFYIGNSAFKTFTENIILMKNLILLREGSNFLGWEYIEIYKKYKIISKDIESGDYSKICMPEDIPQMSDDYLCGYLNFDSNFPLKKVEVALFIIDYCNFLFETDLTNYKLEPLISNFEK